MTQLLHLLRPVTAAVIDVVREVDQGARKPDPQNTGPVMRRAGV